MSNYETQEKLNARAAQNHEDAERRAAQAAQDREKAEQAAVTESAARLVKHRRRATTRLGIRLAVAAGAVALVLLLEWLELVAPVLAISCIVGVVVWASAWVGAWLQYLAALKGRLFS